MKFVADLLRPSILITGVIIAIAQNVQHVSAGDGNCAQDSNTQNGLVNIYIPVNKCCNAGDGKNYCCNVSPSIPVCPDLSLDITNVAVQIFFKLLELVDFQGVLGKVCNQDASAQDGGSGKTCHQVAGNKGKSVCILNAENGVLQSIANCVSAVNINALTGLSKEQQNCIEQKLKKEDNKYNVNCCSVQQNSGNTGKGGGGSYPTGIDCGEDGTCSSKNVASQNGTAQTQCCVSSCSNEVKQSRFGNPSLPIILNI